MALTWDATKVRDYASLTDSEAAVRTALVFGTLGVGLREITDDNVGEFFARLDILQRLEGPFLTGPDGGVAITREDVARFVGLRTNASSETRAQWARRLFVNRQTSITEGLAR